MLALGGATAEASHFRLPSEGLLARGDSPGRIDDRSLVVEGLVEGLRGSEYVEHLDSEELRWKESLARLVEKVLWRSCSAGVTRGRGGGRVQTWSKTSDSRPQPPSLRVGARDRR